MAVSRIFFIGMVMLMGYIGVYAKNAPQDTNISLTQNVQQYNQDTESNINTTKTIIGAVEKVRVIPGNMVMRARIDTGATTTSLGVDEMEIVNEDGVDWAVVKIDDLTMKYKVVKFIRIKQHGSESKRRPVVRLRLILGNVSESVNVTLADRSNFKYQLLIGRNFIYDRFIVDVSLKNTMTPIEYKEK